MHWGGAARRAEAAGKTTANGRRVRLTSVRCTLGFVLADKATRLINLELHGWDDPQGCHSKQRRAGDGQQIVAVKSTSAERYNGTTVMRLELAILGDNSEPDMEIMPNLKSQK